MSDQAGPLISAKSPPPAPDAKPVPHPFLARQLTFRTKKGDCASALINRAVCRSIFRRCVRWVSAWRSADEKRTSCSKPKSRREAGAIVHSASAGLLQRKCACEVARCRAAMRGMPEETPATKLAVNRGDDRFEHEADAGEFRDAGRKQPPCFPMAR